MEEVIGRDLDMLLPTPIQRFHKRVTDLEGQQSKILTNRKLRNLLCLNKKGLCLPLTIKIRYHYDFSNSIKIAGALQFSVERYKICILLLNREGTIKAMTKEADKYFDKERNIDYYNSKFRDINNVSSP